MVLVTLEALDRVVLPDPVTPPRGPLAAWSHGRSWQLRQQNRTSRPGRRSPWYRPTWENIYRKIYRYLQWFSEVWIYIFFSKVFSWKFSDFDAQPWKSSKLHVFLLEVQSHSLLMLTAIANHRILTREQTYHRAFWIFWFRMNPKFKNI